MIGSGESATTVWVPSGLSTTQLALVGRDGSLGQGRIGAGSATARTTMPAAAPPIAMN